MSETELLQAFRREQSEEAFTELVRRYASLVYSVAKRRLANPALAEDVTQIVFIRFAKAPPRVRRQGELAAWLHRTTVNVTIDTWRSETRRYKREKYAMTMESAEADNARWEDVSPNLDQALNELDEKDRQAVLLRFFGGKTMRDVAEVLGVSEDAAKMRVSRALDRLRTQLIVRGVACTSAVLGTLMVEKSIEAAPSQLLSRIAAIRLPMGIAGVSALIARLLAPWTLKLAMSVIVLALIGVAIVAFLRSPAAPDSEVASNSQPEVVDIANERASSQQIRPGDSNEFKVRAKRSTKMLLHVLDSETKIGLAGTQIHFVYFGDGGQGEGHEALTDGMGDAEIQEPDGPGKSRGPNVFVVAEGHVPKVIGFGRRAMPAEYTLKLDPAMTVRGIVVDEQRAPVAGVAIGIESPGANTDQIENIDFQTCAVTNRDDGSWECSYIPKGSEEIRFIIKKPGYAVTFPNVPVSKVNLTNLTLVIDRGRTITGRITDQQNYPVTGARIKVLDGNHSKNQSAQTDENGVFTLSGVAGVAQEFAGYQQPPLETNESGSVMIRGIAAQGALRADLAVQANGFSSQARTVDLAGVTNIANFTLSSGMIFRGRVVDQAGHPLSYVVVQTDYDFAAQSHKKFDWTTRTDRSGRFEWDSAPAQEICYWFEADGYEPIRGLHLSADGKEHEITLRTSSTK
jgi:RNA polymerase sigma factor (sigma-70 family)